MGCECEEPEKKKLDRLRFVGGRRKPRGARGPYLSYVTGEIYEVPPRLVILPYWEPVEKQESTEAETDPEPADKQVSPPEKSAGLTRVFKGTPPSQEEIFAAMDAGMLKSVVESNGGKVDGRWGKKRLIEEALKLQ